MAAQAKRLAVLLVGACPGIPRWFRLACDLTIAPHGCSSGRPASGRLIPAWRVRGLRGRARGRGGARVRSCGVRTPTLPQPEPIQQWQAVRVILRPSTRMTCWRYSRRRRSRAAGALRSAEGPPGQLGQIPTGCPDLFLDRGLVRTEAPRLRSNHVRRLLTLSEHFGTLANASAPDHSQDTLSHMPGKKTAR